MLRASPFFLILLLLFFPSSSFSSSFFVTSLNLFGAISLLQRLPCLLVSFPFFSGDFCYLLSFVLALCLFLVSSLLLFLLPPIVVHSYFNILLLLTLYTRFLILLAFLFHLPVSPGLLLCFFVLAPSNHLPANT